MLTKLLYFILVAKVMFIHWATWRSFTGGEFNSFVGGEVYALVLIIVMHQIEKTKK